MARDGGGHAFLGQRALCKEHVVKPCALPSRDLQGTEKGMRRNDTSGKQVGGQPSRYGRRRHHAQAGARIGCRRGKRLKHGRPARTEQDHARQIVNGALTSH